MEHSIVNKYSDMIADEVDHYKKEMLEYFRVREIHTNDDYYRQSANVNRQLYTTSLAKTIYEIEDYINDESDLTQKTDVDNELSTGKVSSTHLQIISDNDDRLQTQTFLTEDTTSMTEAETIPFYQSFQIPSKLTQSTMFK